MIGRTIGKSVSVDENEMLATSCSKAASEPNWFVRYFIRSSGRRGFAGGPLALILAVIAKVALGRDELKAEKRARRAWDLIAISLVCVSIIAVLLKVFT